MRAVATPYHRSCKVKLIPWRAFRPPAAVPPFALFPPALCAPAFLDSDFFDCPGFVVFRLSRVRVRKGDWAMSLRAADAALYMAKNEGRDRWAGLAGAQQAGVEPSDGAMVTALLESGLLIRL